MNLLEAQMSALTFTFLWPTLFMHTILAKLTFFHMCYRQKHISQCLEDDFSDEP